MGADLGLAGKVALVTGAASGIGRAAALRFAAADVKVLALDRSEAVEETCELVRAAGGEAAPLIADVSRSADMERAVNEAIRRFGRLDCAFNNAGLSRGGAPAVDPWDEGWFERVMAVNVRGVFLVLKFQLRHMIGQGSGAIVNSASIAGLTGYGSPAYVCSKHAVVGLTRVAAVQAAPHGVRVNAVCPGSIATPMVLHDEAARRATLEAVERRVPASRIGEPEDVAEAVVWLCSPAAGYVIGQPLVIDGGWTLTPPG